MESSRENFSQLMNDNETQDKTGFLLFLQMLPILMVSLPIYQLVTAGDDFELASVVSSGLLCLTLVKYPLCLLLPCLVRAKSAWFPFQAALVPANSETNKSWMTSFGI